MGIVTQFHLNNYFKNFEKYKGNLFDTILNFRLSNGTIQTTLDKTKPVNYDILTQTIRSTPSTIKLDPHDDLFLFDMNDEDEIIRNECLKF